jgi:hypothetical protein
MRRCSRDQLVCGNSCISITVYELVLHDLVAMYVYILVYHHITLQDRVFGRGSPRRSSQRATSRCSEPTKLSVPQFDEMYDAICCLCAPASSVSVSSKVDV